MRNGPRSKRIRLPLPMAMSLVVAGLFLAGALLFVLWPRGNGEYRVPDTYAWQTGDLFFSSGNSWKSDLVRMFGGGGEHETSHCGFVLRVNGHPMLVHMSTDRGEIVMESVEEYGRLNGASSVRAMRIIQPVDTVALRRNLEGLLSAHKEFDNSFDHSDTTSYYCTELVVREMQRIGCHLFAPFMDESVIYPQSIESSGYLVPVR